MGGCCEGWVGRSVVKIRSSARGSGKEFSILGFALIPRMMML